jgi:hypothetical protein
MARHTVSWLGKFFKIQNHPVPYGTWVVLPCLKRLYVSCFYEMISMVTVRTPH